MTDDLKVRRAICEAHGLDWPAAKFLTGDTIPELEQSAARLADLLHKERPPEPSHQPPSIFEVAAAEKAERKRTLVNALCGRFREPRDEQGRYTRPAVSFDGGARTTVPRRQTHEEWLADALADSGPTSAPISDAPGCKPTRRLVTPRRSSEDARVLGESESLARPVVPQPESRTARTRWLKESVM